MFHSCKSQFSRQKSGPSHWEISISCTSQKYSNTLLSIFHSIIYQTVLPCGRLKTNENFKLLALKVVTVVYERWSLSYKRFQVWSCDLETFGILENWSLKTGGCFWEVVQLKVRLQAKTFCFAFLITHASLVTKVHNNSQNDLKMADQSSQLPL